MALVYLMAHALSPIGKDRTIAKLYTESLSNAGSFFHTQSHSDAQGLEKHLIVLNVGLHLK